MADPVTPEPDDKDWTWTLQRPCPDCGFDATAARAADVPALVDDVVARVGRRLADPDATTRPAPAVWSTTEYACHLRDVCEIFDERLRAMLTADDPLFANWDQDRTALERRYSEQRPEPVHDELRAAATRIAGTVRGVAADQWSRPGRRSNGSVFTVDSLVRYFAHDLVHHVHDIRG